MRGVMAQVERVAPTESRVCILGETGTGKELVARTLHEQSARHAGAFVTVNCAAVPPELIESELFGHEKGAFTGAVTRHVGKFEQAHRGTLFLDEIGDMPLGMQAKLLRALEEGEIERVGGDQRVRVDVRVLAATHRDLSALVERGQFRADLFHRIYVFPLRLPPLRERQADVPLLVEYFSKQVAQQNGWKPVAFTSEAIGELQKHRWPGNVRELRNVVERLLLVADHDEVSEATVCQVLPRPESAKVRLGRGSGTLAGRVENFEREEVLRELKTHQFNMTSTARALGLERSHLYKKCQQLGIDLRAVRKEDHTEE